MNMPVSPRMLELLEKAADAFDVQLDPFHVDWLAKNKVTLEECVNLSELIGKILHDYWLAQREGGVQTD
ncbi:MAG: hypothetical protein JW730_06860 [Anaerolineales bacterium]|nr:hypothetical protein [Anaerolineales bacterium]